MRNMINEGFSTVYPCHFHRHHRCWKCLEAIIEQSSLTNSSKGLHAPIVILESKTEMDHRVIHCNHGWISHWTSLHLLENSTMNYRWENIRRSYRCTSPSILHWRRILVEFDILLKWRESFISTIDSFTEEMIAFLIVFDRFSQGNHVVGGFHRYFENGFVIVVFSIHSTVQINEPVDQREVTGRIHRIGNHVSIDRIESHTSWPLTHGGRLKRMEIKFVGQGNGREIRHQIRAGFLFTSLCDFLRCFCSFWFGHTRFFLFGLLNTSVQPLCFGMQSIDTISINFRARKQLVMISIRVFFFLFYLVSITEPALTKLGSWWMLFALSSKAMIFKISGRRSTSGSWKAFRALILFFAASSIVFS